MAQFNNVLIYVLIAAAAVSALLGEIVDAAVIVGVVVINAAIGFIQEDGAGAQRHPRACCRSTPPWCATAAQTLPAEELVPGDLVTSASGDRVPADLRLIRARNLQIEGGADRRIGAVQKSVEPVAADAASVTGHPRWRSPEPWSPWGRGTGLVVGTGRRHRDRPHQHHDRRCRDAGDAASGADDRVRPLAHRGIVVLGGSGLRVGVWLRGLAADAFMAAVGIAVAAIPEGLPAVMTITLAIGVTTHGPAQRDHPAPARGRNPGLGQGHLLGQDRHPDPQRDDGARASRPRPADYEVEGIGYQPEGGFLGTARTGRPAAADPAAEIGRRRLLMQRRRPEDRTASGIWNGDPTDGRC